MIQLEKTLTDNTDTGTVPRWHDTTAHYQTYVIGQIFKQLHDKGEYCYIVFQSLNGFVCCFERSEQFEEIFRANVFPAKNKNDKMKILIDYVLRMRGLLEGGFSRITTL